MSDSEGKQSDDGDKAVQEARERVIESMERSADIYGLPRSYGRLYGLLFFAEDPVSLDELVERSGYAKSTVSSAMNDMEQLHMVHRRSVPGEGKKSFYEAERDFWRFIQEFLRGEVQREITIMTRALEEAEETLADVDDAEAKRDLERVQSMRRMYERSQTLVNILTSSSIDRLAGLVERLRRD
ncbi:MAG: GbsR/MarR family transcriptional regulator [Halodesulfurarchaeum sp.]